MKIIKQAVILAGGVGIRMRPLTLKIPKPMIPFSGKPFLEYLIELLKENNITNVVLLVGYLHEKIENYFGDGKRNGMMIKYSYSPKEADTGTRLKNALPLLDKQFLLLYGDNYWPLDLEKLWKFHKRMGKKASVVVYRNIDKYTRNNVVVGSDNLVQVYDRSRKTKGLNSVDIGFFILRKKVLSLLPKTNCSFEDTVIPHLVRQKQISAYVTNNRYYGLSNLGRMEEISKFFKPKKVIFLDRDGVINKKPSKGMYVTKWNQFELLPGTAEGLLKLQKKQYQFFIITNQAGIARKMMTKSDLRNIHKNMLNMLKDKGIKINKIYVCPHGWNDGCYCRKPNPGLLFKAASENQIKLSNAIFVGDDADDVEAGKRAGCKTVYLYGSKRKPIFDFDKNPDILAKTLPDISKLI